MRTAVPDLKALANGSVRGWHVCVLFALAFLLTFAMAHLISRETDPLFRSGWRNFVWGMLTFAFFAIVTTCVPELRRLFVECMRSGTPAPIGDVLVAIAVMLTWGLGAARMLIDYPIALFNPQHALSWLDLGPKAEPGPILFVLGTFSMAVLAPITEEVVFRGYLLNLWLARHRVWVAVWGSSIVFGLWHFKTAPFAALMGVFFALIYLKYRSLLLCMALHGLYNLLMNRLLLGRFFMEKDADTLGSLSSWTAELCFAALFIPFAVLFWKRFRPQSEIS